MPAPPNMCNEALSMQAACSEASHLHCEVLLKGRELLGLLRNLCRQLPCRTDHEHSNASVWWVPQHLQQPVHA